MRNVIFTAMVAVSFAGFAPAAAGNPEPDANLFQSVEGNWDWKEADGFCKKTPHTLSFIENNKKMVLKYPSSGREVTYQVLNAEKNQITMLMDDEERRTDQGDRVAWVLVLNDRDTYQWRRTDWKSKDRTKAILRCKS